MKIVVNFKVVRELENSFLCECSQDDFDSRCFVLFNKQKFDLKLEQAGEAVIAIGYSAEEKKNFLYAVELVKPRKSYKR